MSRTRLLIPAVLILTALLAGCGSPTTVTMVDSSVTLTRADAEAKEVTATEDAAAGDVIETDSDGLAQLRYGDGSLSRFGPDSSVTLTEVGAAEVQRTSVAVDAAETWHRVQKLVADDAVFEVETPVGVAAVRGTAFAVTCAVEPSCEIIVIEGHVEFTDLDGNSYLINPFERLLVPGTDEEPAVVTSYPLSAVNQNEWITKNIELDGEIEDLSAINLVAESADATGNASMTGEWSYESEMISSTIPSEVGEPISRDWTIGDPDCTAACTITVESSSGSTFDVTQTPDGISYAADEQVGCIDGDTGEEIVSDDVNYVTTVEFTIDDTELTEDEFLATHMTGTRTETWTLSSNPNKCANMQPATGTRVYSVNLTRVD